MGDNKQPEDPKYIKELMQPTPSGIAKLIAAWSGLSTETQILILSKLDEIRTPAYLAEKVRINALDSENAYVRYLAAKRFHFSNDCSDEEKLLKEKIDSDPDPLVRYCLLEKTYILPGAKYKDGHIEELDDPALFFDLPHEARLAKVRNLEGNGETIASLISHAIDYELKNGGVSEIELYEILADYLAKPEFHERYSDTRVTYDGWGEYTKGKDIESLWKLVPKLPEGISHILIVNLPEAPGLGNGIPEDVVNSMTDRQLDMLLCRKDIGLEKLRKKLFWEAGEDRGGIKSAAVSYNFQMEYDEFAKILAKPPEERVSILKDLGIMAFQLNLCFYDAIHDALFASNVSPLDFELAIRCARNALERRIRDLEGWKKEKELTELRLYRLANRAVPWDPKEEGYTPSGEIEFLSEVIVPGDTWATFMAFSEAWSRRPTWVKDLDKYLPRIYEIDEDDLNSEESEIESYTEPNPDSELIKGIDEKLADTQYQNEVLRAEFLKLETSLNKQRLLLYAAIGLVVLLLLVQY